MKTAFVRRLILVIAVLFAASVARAEPLKPARVAAEAEWVAHFDVEALAQSRLMQFILTHQDESGIKTDGLDEIKEHLGVDVLRDLKAITFYGRGTPDHDDGQFVAIVTGNSALDGVVEKLQAMHEGYAATTIDGYAVHSFKAEEDNEVFFHIIPGPPERDRVAVVARESAQLLGAIAVLEGKTPSAAAIKHPVLAKPPQPGSFFFLAADGVADLAAAHGHDEDARDPASSVLKETKSLVIDAGESGENGFVQIALDIGREETATNVADLIRGLVALGKLAVNSDPELASLKEAINSIQLKSQGSNITVRLQQKTATILGALQNLHDAEKNKDADEDGGDIGEKDAKKHRHSVEIGVKVGDKKPD